MVFTSWEFQTSYLQPSLKVFFELLGTRAASCALISILLTLLVRPDWVKHSLLFLCMLKWMMVLLPLWLWAAECHQRLFETICLRCPLSLANGLRKTHLLEAEHRQATVACLLWSHAKNKTQAVPQRSFKIQAFRIIMHLTIYFIIVINTLYKIYRQWVVHKSWRPLKTDPRSLWHVQHHYKI